MTIGMLTLDIAMTGEHFVMRSSSRTPGSQFEFTWTLGSGKKGPPEHIHRTESETFHVKSGTIRIWLDDVEHTLAAGQKLVVAPMVRHRFLNPGPEPVVVDVSLSGSAMEDVLVPIALYARQHPKFGFTGICRMIVHDVAIRGSEAPSAVLQRWVFGSIAGALRLFGAKPFAIEPDWASRGY